ncbi:hypothetical protein K402DRAFT_391707 [Aulographum hederae CBS 113979]|uniref:Uncharacterized protein n=1 Tax=Aulographum hederae CBS 113979 TaxID=1176131 RepID=A0A6G1H5H7_9PEZI|nr:hypothetical protein K402DRAFT_391707 [Aulographum hederae CBS 113979]
MGFTNPPFALFVLVDTSHDTLNAVLKDAYNATGVTWLELLSTSSYADTIKRDPKKSHPGSTAPVDESFKSPFVGKKVEDVAEWIMKKPDDVDVDSHFFAIVDRRAEKDTTLVVCRIGDKYLKGEELSAMRFSAHDASLHLGGMEFGLWEDFVGEDGKGGGLEKIEY